MESKSSTTEKKTSSLEDRMLKEDYPMRDGCSFFAFMMIAVVFVAVLLCLYFLIRRIVICL